MQIFTNSVETGNSPVYSAPPCTSWYVCVCARVCSGRYGASGVATGWTGVDMSTPLLLQVAPAIDTNPTSYYRGRGVDPVKVRT